MSRIRQQASALPRKVRNRLGRVRWYRWRHRAYVSAGRPIVIGGSPRSGTTLLRRLLDAHPRITCGPESSVFLPGAPQVALIAHLYQLDPAELERLVHASPSQAAWIDAFFGDVLERAGKERWAEKTPLNVAHLDWIWEHFPEARFIQVVRDGRDVVCSMRRHRDRRLVDGRMVEIERDPEPIDVLTRQWVRATGQGIGHRGDPRYLEIRYEELVEQPRAVMERLLTWLGEPFEEAILTERETADGPMRRGAEWDARGSIERSSVGRWKTDLAPEDVAAFKRHGTQRLIELGYADGPDWS